MHRKMTDQIPLNGETIMALGSERPDDRSTLELAVALAVAADRAALLLAARVALRAAPVAEGPLLEASETKEGWSV